MKTACSMRRRAVLALWLALTTALAPGLRSEGALPDEASTADADVEAERDLLEGVLDKMPVQGWEQSKEEATAYNYLLVKASRTPLDALARHARRDLTLAHLMEEPSKYRGTLVHLEGRLRRLVRFDAPALAAADGVPHVYEAWIFGAAHYANPTCVLVGEVAPGIRPGERVDYPVACDAYFFKRYRYAGGDGVYDAPLLIGRALLSRQAGGERSTEARLLYWFVAFAAGVAGGVALLAWWFWHSDRRARQRLARLRRSPFVGQDSYPDGARPSG